MTFPRQLRPALFYYRTSCTYRYNYLSPTDSWGYIPRSILVVGKKEISAT